ncbi:S-layer homology domain-containing protein [Sinanaerobacter chloroacetimidivorans]|uniref:S-layer homology domain-containing protein n=1 Tax=Sinanaerobacter chloroacetimidivorans TaxID=2818044 RepID=A0A8J8B1Y5_9FIRM|nr:S-layer homology domain-containing protein [Sinanaerobacter chloroacetimidivorans]MBR0599198.1 S-layer homology domain-containing protein [Sinanaerobacter chloroacetimidivorans]
MRLKKIGSGLLAIMLAVTIAAPSQSFGAGKLTDTAGHWAESYINTAVNKGIITGYQDKTFLPDKAVTRAEFATMINKALGNGSSASIGFADVPYYEWYYDAVSKAVSASYAGGYDDNTFKPNNPITRQEAAVMISRIVPAYKVSGNLKSYSDYKTIADWAYDAMARMNGKGYIGAYSDGKIHPTDPLTRAQTAKIICDILDNETIVTSSPVIDDDGTKLSNKIYVNNVTIDEDLGDDSATIDNCVILGNLNVKGGGEDTITINNSRVSNVTVDKDDSAVRILAKGETSIAKLSASESSILQTASLSGGFFGPGFSNITINSSAEVTLKGSFPLVNINGSKANVILDSGTITTLNVTGSGKYSNITASGSTTISQATVNSESYFHGTGTITKMNVNADGITYETKPKSWTIASRVDTPKEADAVLSVTFSPKNKATDVKLDTKITITFGSAMKLRNGSSISNSDISDFITIRKSSTSGSKVSFSATINSAKKEITITPSSNLSENTRYYVIIEDNTLKDSDGNTNDEQSIYFNTGTATSAFTTTYSPANGATGISINPSINITFSESVVRYSNGNTISTNDSYLKECIVFRKDSASGTEVPYSVSISSAKKITITPNSSLEANKKYYVAVLGSRFKTSSNGTAVAASSATWTVGVSAPSLSNFSLSALDTSITASFNPNVAGKVYLVAIPVPASGSVGTPSVTQIKNGKTSTDQTAAASQNTTVTASTSKSVTFSNLDTETSYKFFAVLEDSQGNPSSIQSDTAKTTSLNLKTLSIRPNGGSNILSSSFSSTNYSYTDISVPNGTSYVDVNAVANREAFVGEVTINNTVGNSLQVDLQGSPGSRTARIEVKIQEIGKSPRLYTVTVKELGSTKLQSVTINGNPYTIGSNYEIAADTSDVSLMLTPEDSSAILTMSGQQLQWNQPIPLSLSDTTNMNPSVTFTVRTADGRSTQDHVIRFKRTTPTP